MDEISSRAYYLMRSFDLSFHALTGAQTYWYQGLIVPLEILSFSDGLQFRGMPIKQNKGNLNIFILIGLGKEEEYINST